MRSRDAAPREGAAISARPSIRVIAATVAVLTLLPVLGGCSPVNANALRAQVSDVPGGSTLALGIGFETVIDAGFDWQAFAQSMERADVDAVTIAVGRPEWVAFPWAGQEDRWAAQVTAGSDPVAAAIDAVRERNRPEITLVIDTAMPLAIAADPALAGVSADGRVSDIFPSVSSLDQGEIADGIVALCEETARRYRPDRIALTELILEASFGASDRAHFEAVTGRTDFPRESGGRIDQTHPEIVQWRSSVLQKLISRCAEVAAPFGTTIDTDMRVNWQQPGSDREDSGHSYEVALADGNSLTLWNYFALEGRRPEVTAALVAGLGSRFDADQRRRVAVSIGLWSASESDTEADTEADTVLSPADLRTALAYAWNAAGTVSVTPVSLLTDEHWQVLEEARDSN